MQPSLQPPCGRTEAYNDQPRPFPNCRSSVIGLAIAGNPENDGTCRPGKRRSGMRSFRTHKNGYANEATTGLTHRGPDPPLRRPDCSQSCQFRGRTRRDARVHRTERRGGRAVSSTVSRVCRVRVACSTVMTSPDFRPTPSPARNGEIISNCQHTPQFEHA
jgi:hypothetical protein